MVARLDDETVRATVEALAAHGGNVTRTAAALGLDRNTVYKHVTRAAARGLDGSAAAPPPPGQVVKGVSTLSARDPATGAWSARMQWTKTREEGLTPADFAAEVRAAAEDMRGVLPATPPPAPEDAAAGRFHLCPWPDLHLGMLSWGAETGEDFDLAIAEALVRASFTELVARLPPAEEAILLGLGDLLHADDDTAQTRRSGAHLDVDSRQSKVRRAALGLVTWAVGVLLARFPRVTVRILPGNHDEQSAGAIADALALFYDAEPRVAFDADPSLWWFSRRGRVLLGATHGHTVKPEEMPGVMAARRPADWGATDFRYFLHGHLHHKRAISRMGVPVECLQSVVPPDAFHHGAGLGSGRALVAITYGASEGEIGRSTVNIATGAPA